MSSGPLGRGCYVAVKGDRIPLLFHRSWSGAMSGGRGANDPREVPRPAGGAGTRGPYGADEMRAAVRRALSTLGAIGLVAFIATVAPAARSELPPPTADPHGNYSSESANCESCHTPHGSETSKLFVRSSQSLTCLRCHDGSGGGPNIGEQFQRPSTHPVADGTLICSDCHTPHRSTEEDTKLLRAAGADGTFVYSPPSTPIGNDFCYSCHGSAPGGTTPGLEGFDESAHNVHGEDPSSGSGIMCLTCHRPHGSNNL